MHKTFSKVRGSCKGDKFINYKRFAILLQRVESYLMIEKVVKRIRKEYPGTICITVHDSLMTGILTNNFAAAREILLAEFEEFIGFKPLLKIEGSEIKNIEGGDIGNRIHYVPTTFVTVN